MEIAIRKEKNGSIYIDKTALSRFDKATLTQPPYNFRFVEVDKEDCEVSDFNEDLTFNLDKYNKRKRNYALQDELTTLLLWFNEYDNQTKQYNRCQRLGIEYDKDINELDNQAKAKAERITEIRKILKN